MIENAGWLSVAAMLVALAFLAVLFQHRFIYFPLRYTTTQLQEARRAVVEEIRFQTSQGNQAAFFWRNEDLNVAPKNIWLLFGGNGDLALTWMSLIRTFPNSDAGYLLIDYPGYGICEGRAKSTHNPGELPTRAPNSFGKESLETGHRKAVCSGTLARRSRRPPIRNQKSCPQDYLGFHLHHHGRYGSETDSHPSGTTSSTSVRQRCLSKRDLVTKRDPGDLHFSWRSRRRRPVENGAIPGTARSEADKILRNSRRQPQRYVPDSSSV